MAKGALAAAALMSAPAKANPSDIAFASGQEPVMRSLFQDPNIERSYQNAAIAAVEEATGYTEPYAVTPTEATTPSISAAKEAIATSASRSEEIAEEAAFEDASIGDLHFPEAAQQTAAMAQEAAHNTPTVHEAVAPTSNSVVRATGNSNVDEEVAAPADSSYRQLFSEQAPTVSAEAALSFAHQKSTAGAVAAPDLEFKEITSEEATWAAEQAHFENDAAPTDTGAAAMYAEAVKGAVTVARSRIGRQHTRAWPSCAYMGIAVGLLAVSAFAVARYWVSKSARLSVADAAPAMASTASTVCG